MKPPLSQDRTISLDQNLDAVGCFLEYLYTGDYFPRKVAGHAHSLESDPTVPEIDETGDQLLKHARVYTLAEEFTMPDLQSLASSKIHCVQSTAQGEIAYARYVYAYTKPEDTTVRHPVAKFWAMRSHTLRAEAEKEFQALCLEHPLFAYDVLSMLGRSSLPPTCIPLSYAFMLTVQPASWTRSSSESETTRCTRHLHRAARASARETAAASSRQAAVGY